MAEPFLCPGCGKDMSGYMGYDAHYADDVDPRPKNGRHAWPWTDSKNAGVAHGTVCVWTRDYLSAEWLRRNPQPWSYT